MRTEEVLSYELLNKLYTEQKNSDSEIADMFKLSLGQVHRLRNKYRIKTIEQFERHTKQTLDEQEVNLLVGLMLGDAHMRLRPGKNTYPCLMIEQSVKHKEYIFWLKDCLKDWLFDPTKAITQNRHPNKNGQTYHSFSFATVCNPAFFQIYHAFSIDGKKRLNNRKFITDNFNIISLAAWIMDDGTLSGNCKRNNIATNNFTFEEVNFLRDMLREKFGLKTWICKRTGKDHINYEIAFDKKSSIVLSNLLRDIVVPSMRYKLLPSETTNDTVLADISA